MWRLPLLRATLLALLLGAVQAEPRGPGDGHHVTLASAEGPDDTGEAPAAGPGGPGRDGCLGPHCVPWALPVMPRLAPPRPTLAPGPGTDMAGAQLRGRSVQPEPAPPRRV